MRLEILNESKQQKSSRILIQRCNPQNSLRLFYSASTRHWKNKTALHILMKKIVHCFLGQINDVPTQVVSQDQSCTYSRPYPATEPNAKDSQLGGIKQYRLPRSGMMSCQKKIPAEQTVNQQLFYGGQHEAVLGATATSLGNPEQHLPVAP